MHGAVGAAADQLTEMNSSASKSWLVVEQSRYIDCPLCWCHAITGNSVSDIYVCLYDINDMVFSTVYREEVEVL